MQREMYQVTIASVWVLLISVAAVASGVTSLWGLVSVTLIALMPVLVMRRFWRDPPQTMSEAIREARR